MTNDSQESSFEDLVSEAHDNANEDRARLKEYVEGLKKAVDGDPNLAAVVGDSFVKASDILVKCNNQIIGLAQLKLKSRGRDKQTESGLSEDEAENVYGSIGVPFEQEEKN